jgi:hypothetical protein
VGKRLWRTAATKIRMMLRFHLITVKNMQKSVDESEDENEKEEEHSPSQEQFLKKKKKKKSKRNKNVGCLQNYCNSILENKNIKRIV